MKLGSKYKFSEVEMRDWEQFATAAGLSVAQSRKRILELSKQLPLTARKLQSAEGKGFANHPMVGQIINLIEQRAAQTIKRLSEPTSEPT